MNNVRVAFEWTKTLLVALFIPCLLVLISMGILDIFPNFKQLLWQWGIVGGLFPRTLLIIYFTVCLCFIRTLHKFRQKDISSTILLSLLNIIIFMIKYMIRSGLEDIIVAIMLVSAVALYCKLRSPMARQIPIFAAIFVIIVFGLLQGQ